MVGSSALVRNVVMYRIFAVTGTVPKSTVSLVE
jgi:hypothetical protein